MHSFNHQIINILRDISDLNNHNVNSVLHIEENTVYLSSNDDVLFRVSQDSMELFDDYKIGDKISSTQKELINYEVKDWVGFLNSIKNNIRGINHLGMGYACKDIDAEIQKYSKHISTGNFSISEEKSSSKNQRWFFVGNRTQWETPLFEIVMSDSKSKYQRSHFQIDLDTNLDFEMLNSLVSKYLRKNFIDFKIDVHGYGVVLVMGRIMASENTDIYLGLGTKLRNNRIHRLKELQEI